MLFVNQVKDNSDIINYYKNNYEEHEKKIRYKDLGQKLEDWEKKHEKI